MIVAGIRVFIDNERLHVGEVIGDELMSAIDDSKICMPVFSNSYASSKWCLLELERIMMGRIGHEIWPIFYDVTPNDVKLKTTLYSDHLDLLQKDHGPDMVNGWRECLKEVCKIKGWNSKEYQGEGKMIQRIVKEVLYKTKTRYINVTDHLICIDGQIEKMMKLLDDQIDRVRFVIIHGMGGIGKTTLAKVIFNDVSSKFEGCSFLLNVRESSQGNGIVKLQQQILNDVLGTSVRISNENDGVNEIRKRCRNKRVLLVLDDVDDEYQIQKLAGMFDWFGGRSRIIITTRDSKVIPNGLLSFDAQRKNKKQKIEGEDDHRNICYYEIHKMDHQHATTLFKRHAFGVEENSFVDEDLLQKIVVSTGGLPLALEIVGSHLFGETVTVWGETLRMLKKAPLKRVQNALMISYEALEDNEKQIFLDIACFFWGTERRALMYLWEASDLCPESGVNALLHKSLIKIDDGDRIWMHDQLKDLGREIVRNNGKSCRIWMHEEAFRMISTKKGTRDVIFLDLGELSTSCKFEKAAFGELVNLRVLQLEGGNLVGDFSNCFPKLLWLEWRSFPSNFQAQNFSPPNLVVLRLGKSFNDKTDIDKRWTGWKGLLGSKLKFLELSDFGGLKRTPDFSTCLGLEVLVLRNNWGLVEIDSSIGKLEQLLHLDIKGSLHLRGLSQSIDFHNLKSLCHLAIEHVSVLSLPKGIGQLKQLKYLSLLLLRTRLEVFLRNIGSMKELKVLNLTSSKMRTLPEGIGGLVKLEELDLSFCRELEQIPSEIGNLFSLRLLNLSSTGIVELPSSVIRLSCLQRLFMDSCSKLRKVEQLPTSLSELVLPYFSLQVVPELSNLVNIIKLVLDSYEPLINDHGAAIKDDEEDRWTRFISLASIERLHKLKRLVIGVKLGLSCSVAQFLSQLPHNLNELTLEEFRATTLDLSLFPNLSELFIFCLSSDEIELRGLEVLGNLQKIGLRNCESLTSLSISFCPKKLNSLEISNCPKLVEVKGLSRLESLQTLRLWHCPSLLRLSDLSNLVKVNELVMLDCGSIERMPALRGKPRDFFGRNDLYVGK